MGGFNLPPGVSVSDIPGNRPEDLAEEKFTEELAGKLLADGWSQAQVDSLFEDDHLYSAIVAARDLGWNGGVEQGKEDAYVEEQLIREAEAQVTRERYDELVLRD